MEKYSNCWYESVCQKFGENCQNMCVRYKEMRYLMDNSNLPPKKQQPQRLEAPDCDFDAYCRLAEIKDDIVNFVADGKSLYLTSSHTGNGKTTWVSRRATSITRILVGVRGIFFSFHKPSGIFNQIYSAIFILRRTCRNVLGNALLGYQPGACLFKDSYEHFYR